MKKFFTLLATFCLSFVLATPGFAAPTEKQSLIISLSPHEKIQLHEKRVFEDSNMTGTVPPPTKEGIERPDLPGEPQIEAESYILMDKQTGAILASKKKDDPRPPASMTKMMTAYLVLDRIQQGKIQWDDIVTVSKRAADIDESQIFLIENEKISVKELFTGLMVQSGNDAAVALAEYVAGSEEEFVNQMNGKAKQLGIKNTHFNNSSGLDKKDYPDPPKTEGDHYMSAYDTAILAKKLITVHPEIFNFSTITHYTFHPRTDREQKSENWNKMLPGLKHEYQGVDGLKTGSTQAAGYCFTGTVEQKNTRFISVVMGTTSLDKRFTETAKLYDYGFQSFKQTTLKRAGQSVSTAPTVQVQGASQKHVSAVLQEDIRLPIHIEEKDQYTLHVKWKQNLQAPLKKGAIVGTVEVYYKGHKIPGLKSYNLVTKEKVEKANPIIHFFERLQAS